MKNKILFISLAVALALSIGLVGCGGDGVTPGPASDKIYIFAPRPLQGPLETIGDFAFGPVMDYWQDGVNRAGGIDVGGTFGDDKMVDLTIADDLSDMTQMSYLLSTAIASNDYHFMMPPCSTSFLQSAAGTCSANGYVLLGAEGGCTTIQNLLDTTAYKYLFATLTFSTWGQMKGLCDVLRGYQAQAVNPLDDPADVFVMYIGDTHGFEYRDGFWAEAKSGANAGKFTSVGNMSVPIDAVSVETQLKAAQTANADVLLSFTYPPASMLTVGEAIGLGINFGAICVGPGMNFEFMLLEAVSGVKCNLDLQGVMGFITFNEASGGNVTAQFTTDFSNFFGQAPGTTVYGTTREINGVSPIPMWRFIMDWWGAMPYVAGLEMFQQAIERSHSVDNDDIRTEFAKGPAEKFTTTFGDAWFVNPKTMGAPGANSGGLMCLDFYHGHIGQWQYDAGNVIIPPPGFAGINSTSCGKDYWGWMIYEIIDGAGNTSTGIYPKPNWGYRP